MKNVIRQFKNFLYYSDQIFQIEPKRSTVILLLLISIGIQSLLAFVPAIIGSIPRNREFYLGVFIIVSVAIILRTLASAALLQIFIGRASAGEKKMTFQWMLVISLYCQMILLIGKIAAVCISLLLYLLRIEDRFSVIRFIDLSRIAGQFGWTIPESVGRADVFTLIFIVILARLIRSVTDLSWSSAVAAAAANWLLIAAVQRMVIELPMAIWG